MTSPCSGALAEWWQPLSPAWLQIRGWQRSLCQLLGYYRRRSWQGCSALPAAQPGKEKLSSGSAGADPGCPGRARAAPCAIPNLLGAPGRAGAAAAAPGPVPCAPSFLCSPGPRCCHFLLSALLTCPPAPPRLCPPPHPCWDLRARLIPCMDSQSPPFIYFFFYGF